MNVELIKKYKKEFDHFINEGCLIVMLDGLDEDWFSIGKFSSIWNKNYLYKIKHILINDEYIELRKALAEGKTVQFYKCIEQHPSDSSLDNYGWVDWSNATPSSSYIKTLKYRIKPEEPNFRVGDFVENTKSSLRIIKQVTAVAEGCDTVTVGDKKVGINVMLITDLRLWKPTQGEWCWFYNTYNNVTVLDKFSFTDGINYYSIDNHFMEVYGEGVTLSNSFNECVPFIGELPPRLKD